MVLVRVVADIVKDTEAVSESVVGPLEALCKQFIHQAAAGCLVQPFIDAGIEFCMVGEEFLFCPVERTPVVEVQNPDVPNMFPDVGFFISGGHEAFSGFEGRGRLFEEFSSVQVLAVQINFQAERFRRFRSDSKDSLFSFVRSILETFLKIREIALDHDVF